MSSQQVQYLQKQIQRRDAQIQVLLMALDGCEREKELSESVACAFAWDLAGNFDDTPEKSLRRWEEALKAARAARTATEIALEEAGK